MKKIFGIMTAVFLMSMLMLSGASAEGEYTIVRQDFRVHEDNGTTYFSGYAMVENTSDTPIEIKHIQFTYTNEAGEAVMQSKLIVNMNPSVLMPGEYGYLSNSEWTPDVRAEEFAAMTITMEASKTTYTAQRFPCKTEWVPNLAVDQWFTKNFMIAEITNDTDEVLYGFECTLVLKDEDGRLLDKINEHVNGNIGIPPGGSIVVRREVNQDIIEGLEADHLVMDAIAYVIHY